MKVLMFGWEFPPHISGGLGTACYGLTKSLAVYDDLEILFVVPKLYGDEDEKVASLIGAGDVMVKQSKTSYSATEEETTSKTFEVKSDIIKGTASTETLNLKKVSFIEVKSLIQPYLSPDQFDKFLKERNLEAANLRMGEDGKFYYLKEGETKVLKSGFKLEKDTWADGKYIFSGKYGTNLMQEVDNYAKVAAVIATENDFDIIHAHDWLTYAAGIAAKAVSGKPLIVHVHATEYDRGGEGRINTIVHALETNGMQKADHVITVSNKTKDTAIHRYGISPEKITTVYNAVEPQPGEDRTFKKNVDEKIITFLGRITIQKGPAYFVSAAKKVLDKVDNVRFVMAGNGDMFEEMIEYAAKLKISDKFHFTNFLKGDDVTNMFAISDVYVMPSMSEPFGISPLEAMRSNIPVIISHESGVAEVVTTAVKTHFWDDDAMAYAIHAFIKYKGLTKMFKKGSKKEVLGMKWDKPAGEVKAIYDMLYQRK